MSNYETKQYQGKKEIISIVQYSYYILHNMIKYNKEISPIIKKEEKEELNFGDKILFYIFKKYSIKIYKKELKDGFNWKK